MRGVSVRLFRRCKSIEPSQWASVSLSSNLAPRLFCARLITTLREDRNGDKAPRRRPTPSKPEVNSTMVSQDVGMGILKQAYIEEDMEVFYQSLKTFASTNYRKNVNDDLIAFFSDKNGKLPSKVSSSLHRLNIGNVAWAIARIHLYKANPQQDLIMIDIGLQLLALLSRMNDVNPRQMSTALLALADLGVTWDIIPENDALFILMTLLKKILELDATGVANVFVALSKFNLRWMDLSAELQQILLLRLTHKSKDAYHNAAYTMNCIHFSTVLHHLGLMGFKYNESHPRVQALIEEMICRIVSSIDSANSISHVEQAIRSSLAGLSTVGCEFGLLKELTKSKITSIVSLDMRKSSPLTIACNVESLGKLKLYWCNLTAEQQASFAALLEHHLPYMTSHELGLTILGLGHMHAAGEESAKDLVKAVEMEVDSGVKQLQLYDVARVLAGFGKLDMRESKLNPNTRNQLVFKFLSLQYIMSPTAVAMCLRGFAAMQWKVSGEENRNLHRTLVAAFVRVMQNGTTGAEISEAIFGFGRIEFHRLHLLPSIVKEAVEAAILKHLTAMSNTELTNTLIGLSAMSVELSKLSPGVSELLQTTLSERTTMPVEQLIEAQHAIHFMRSVNNTTRKSPFKKQPQHIETAVQLLNDADGLFPATIKN